jgi:DNA-binding protein WhiA
MSFSSDTKNEMCRVKITNDCCAVAELYGALLFSNMLASEEIRIVTENAKFAARVASLVHRLFGHQVAVTTENENSKKEAITIRGARARTIYERFGYDSDRDSALHLNAALAEEEHCRDAFIRGAFLAGGSVTAPEKNYHLELVTRHFNLSREVMALLLDMGFSPKSTVRKSTYMLYFKDSEEIEAFLTRCSAPVAALRVMEAKVEKELRNRINRKVNCETANILKTVDASQRQLEAIRRLKDSGVFDSLDGKLRYAAELRAANPEATLGELASLANGGISRSGLNHRLGKLVSIADELALT